MITAQDSVINGWDKRKASHAGTWYSNKKDLLHGQIKQFLSEAGPADKLHEAPANIFIMPHAGLQYSGQTAAFGYRALQNNFSSLRRIYLFGPTHHVNYGQKLGLSRFSEYETPLGNLKLDKDEINRIFAEVPSRWLSRQDEEDEHCLELQLPFIKYLENLKGSDDLKIIPILVSSVEIHEKSETFSRMKKYLFKQIIDQGNTAAVIISSDFCHHGPRFHYHIESALRDSCLFRLDSMKERNLVKFNGIQPTEMFSNLVQKCENVGVLDSLAIALFCDESADYRQFDSYFRETGNTVCGRNALRLWKRFLFEEGINCNFKLAKYHFNKSSSGSVSYASIIGYFGNQ